MKNQEIIAEIEEEIIPSRLIFNSKSYVIDRVSNKFKINRVRIYFTQSQKVKKVVIDGMHPNSDPETGEFCLPKDLVFRKVDPMIIPTLKSALMTFNLDDCYYQPWGEFYYSKEEI